MTTEAELDNTLVEDIKQKIESGEIKKSEICFLKKKRKAIFGRLAVVLAVASFVPLIIHATFDRQTYAIHYIWIFVSALASIFWLIYGVANHLLPNIIGSIASIVILLYIFFIKFYFESTGKSRTGGEYEPLPAIE